MSAAPGDVLERRIGAAVVDLALLSLLSLAGGSLLLWFALSLGYYGVLEAISGQTLGKRLFGIRVTAADGESKPTARQVATRTVLRLVDGIGFYAVALAFALTAGERRRRLGDVAARTVVVPVR